MIKNNQDQVKQFDTEFRYQFVINKRKVQDFDF